MSGRPPPRPFELDPTRVEVVAEPEPMLPAAVEAEPVEPPPRGNRWLKWLGISGGIAIAAAVTVQSVQFTQGLMQESPFLGWPFAILLGIVGVTAVGALGRELHELYRLSRRATTRPEDERLAARPSRAAARADRRALCGAAGLRPRRRRLPRARQRRPR